MATRLPAGSRSRAAPIATAALVLLFAALFVIEIFTTGVDPSSFMGEVLGTAAAVSLLVVMTYSARRSMPAVRTLGVTRRYLNLHIWGGVLFLALLLLHTGFRLPRAPLTIALYGTSMWVIVTGLVGWWLQRTIPKLLEPSASIEANLERIPEFVADLRKRAETLARGADPAVKTYYEQRLAPSMAAPRFLTPAMFASGLARKGSGESAEADLLRRTLAPQGVTALDSIRELHATKRGLDVHFTFQRILRGWLFLHLPVAIALILLVAVHVFFVVYY
jgi:hypothetical protein